MIAQWRTVVTHVMVHRHAQSFAFECGIQTLRIRTAARNQLSAQLSQRFGTGLNLFTAVPNGFAHGCKVFDSDMDGVGHGVDGIQKEVKP